LNDVEAIHVPHLDVEQHEVGPMFFHRADNRSAILAFARDFNIFFFLEKPAEPLSRDPFVIDNQDPQHLVN
jgi:hypothetical protein